MKDFLHKPVTLDSFFKEKLEQLPVDMAGYDLQWQSIRQQVKKGPPRLPGANAITICMIVVTTMLLLWAITNKKTIAPEASNNPLPQEHNQPEKKEQQIPAAAATPFHKPIIADSTNEQLLPASPVISTNDQKNDSAKKIVIAIRPDSSKKMAVPESKDSLYIFW
jgi:cell division protein FtsN